MRDPPLTRGPCSVRDPPPTLLRDCCFVKNNNYDKNRTAVYITCICIYSLLLLCIYAESGLVIITCTGYNYNGDPDEVSNDCHTDGDTSKHNRSHIP